ncbi:MAG: B12-binding domain-containing radical SAM protein [Candidatus Odinarchaeota archaeon]
MLASRPLIEFNSVVKNTSKVDVLFGYCYPSTYRAGMTGLALQILYSTLNAREDTSCERYFRHQTQSPVHSIESNRPLRDNHIIGFTLTYEEDILNLIQMLDLGKIPVVVEDRTDNDPIVVVGGPVVSSNPEPYVDFVDVFAIGEGDIIVHNIVEIVKSAGSRDEAIAAMAEIDGLYVPITKPSSVSHITIADLDTLEYPIAQVIPDVDEESKLEPVFGKSFLLEVTRGCGHSCKFCLVGHICQPRRTRSLERLQELVEQGIERTPVTKVSLIGSSLGDLDSLEDLVCWMVTRGVEVSAPSLRADSISKNLLECLVKGGQRTLTIAPETGSPALRKSMGKGLTDSDIDMAVKTAESVGYNSLKLYFIIGLPGETQADIDSTVRMIQNIAKNSAMRITASVNPFIPKARTRWEMEPQLTLDALRGTLRYIEDELKSIPRVTLETLDLRSARIQAALSIGGRSLGEVIRTAAVYGGYGGWRRAEKETGIPFLSLASDPDRFRNGIPWVYLKR